MASSVVKVIGTGGDYTTLQSWEDALPANLVTDDSIQTAELKNQEFTAAGVLLAIAGQTTDATRYIVVKCQAGASFVDNASVRSNALYYNASNGAGIRNTTIYTYAVTCTTPYTRFQGLQIKASGGASQALCVTSLATGCRADSCLCESSNNSGSGASLDFFLSGSSVVTNCVAVQLGSGYGFYVGTNGNAYACTAVRPSGGGAAGFASGYGGGVIKNCAGFGFTNFASLTGGGSPSWGAGSGYNATDAASATGSNNQTSLTFSSQFESATNDFRAKSTGNLHAGTPDATNYPNDITGTSRSASTPWIGAWEISSGGVTGTGSTDTTPPTLSSPAVSSTGGRITATISESGCTPSSGTGGFTLYGTNAIVSSWSISGTTLTLNLNGRVLSSETVTYSYARADTTNDITDAATNYLADFSATAVTNNSTISTLTAGTVSLGSSGPGVVYVNATDATKTATYNTSNNTTTKITTISPTTHIRAAATSSTSTYHP
jgi:hypothetical protein